MSWNNRKRKFSRGALIASLDEITRAYALGDWIFGNNGRPSHPSVFIHQSVHRLNRAIKSGELRLAVRDPSFPYIWKAQYLPATSVYNARGWASCSEIPSVTIEAFSHERDVSRNELQELCLRATHNERGPSASVVVRYTEREWCWSPPPIRLAVEGGYLPANLRPSFQDVVAGRTRQELREAARLLGVPVGRNREDTINNLQSFGPSIIGLLAAFIK